MDKNLLRAQLLMEAADLLNEESYEDYEDYEDFEELDEDTRWAKEGRKQFINSAKDAKVDFNKSLDRYVNDINSYGRRSLKRDIDDAYSDSGRLKDHADKVKYASHIVLGNRSPNVEKAIDFLANPKSIKSIANRKTLAATKAMVNAGTPIVRHFGNKAFDKTISQMETDAASRHDKNSSYALMKKAIASDMKKRVSDDRAEYNLKNYLRKADQLDWDRQRKIRTD